jgi:hypothetical protein
MLICPSNHMLPPTHHEPGGACGPNTNRATPNPPPARVATDRGGLRSADIGGVPFDDARQLLACLVKRNRRAQ